MFRYALIFPRRLFLDFLSFLNCSHLVALIDTNPVEIALYTYDSHTAIEITELVFTTPVMKKPYAPITLPLNGEE